MNIMLGTNKPPPHIDSFNSLEPHCLLFLYLSILVSC